MLSIHVAFDGNMTVSLSCLCVFTLVPQHIATGLLTIQIKQKFS